MLPEGWRRSTLGEIARVTSGGTPDRSEPSYWGGSVPWVTTGEIQFNTINDTAEKITEAGLKNSSAKLFPPGTLLMAMYVASRLLNALDGASTSLARLGQGASRIPTLANARRGYERVLQSRLEVTA